MKRTAFLLATLGIGFCPTLIPIGLGHSTVLAQVGANKKTSEADTQLSDTVAMVSTLYLYQTYLNIGLLADCKAEGVYDEKQTKPLLSSILLPLDAVEKQLQGIAKSLPTKAERDRVEKIHNVIPRLRKQGKELQQFWETGRVEHAKNYDTARLESWQSLSALMGSNASDNKKK